MNKFKLGSCISVLPIMLTSMVMITDASANPTIFAKATKPSIGILVNNCASCHTTSTGPTLKTGYQAAYNLDKTNLTKLKTLINGGVVVPGTVGLATSGLAKTDVYTVTCATGTASLYVRTKDLAPVKTPKVSVQAIKVTSSPLSTDAVDGNADFSPWIKLAKGAGAYKVNVNKSASTVIGAESYTAEFSCRNASNIKTGTISKIVQNQ